MEWEIEAVICSRVVFFIYSNPPVEMSIASVKVRVSLSVSTCFSSAVVSRRSLEEDVRHLLYQLNMKRMRLQLLTCSSVLSLSIVRQFHVNKTISDRHEDEVSNAVKNAGYRGEVHKVKTVDGYALKVHRILPAKQSVHKGTAFLMHGLFRNSSDFIATGPKIALAYYLADHGYDVWMGNARGTTFSREHEKHPSKSKQFWKFSFHEIGLYDVSAMLDFMFDHTKEAKTFYAGHSQGTCSLLALLSLTPSYNDKIIQAHLMTPATFMRHSSSPMVVLPAKQSKVVMVSQ